MNRNRYILLVLFFLSTSLYAQNFPVSINMVKGCAGEEVLLGVVATNLYNIGSITLYVNVDTNKLTFLSLENRDAQLNELYYNFIENPPKVAVVWNEVVAGNFPQTKLFDLKFKIKETGTAVSFASGCEVATSSYKILGIDWINGGVDSANPLITTQPKNVTTGADKDAIFSIISPDASGYQWEESRDGLAWQEIQNGVSYNGVISYQLVIKGTPITLNNNKYRCILRNGDCRTISETATLHVESSSSVNELLHDNNVQLQIHPNPAVDFTNIDYSIPGDGNVHIRIYSLIGKQMMEIINSYEYPGQHDITVSTVGLPKGLYICQLDFSDENGSRSIGRKMLKN